MLTLILPISLMVVLFFIQYFMTKEWDYEWFINMFCYTAAWIMTMLLIYLDKG